MEMSSRPFGGPPDSRPPRVFGVSSTGLPDGVKAPSTGVGEAGVERRRGGMSCVDDGEGSSAFGSAVSHLPRSERPSLDSASPPLWLCSEPVEAVSTRAAALSDCRAPGGGVAGAVGVAKRTPFSFAGGCGDGDSATGANICGARGATDVGDPGSEAETRRAVMANTLRVLFAGEVVEAAPFDWEERRRSTLHVVAGRWDLFTKGCRCCCGGGGRVGAEGEGTEEGRGASAPIGISSDGARRAAGAAPSASSGRLAATPAAVGGRRADGDGRLDRRSRSTTALRGEGKGPPLVAVSVELALLPFPVRGESSSVVGAEAEVKLGATVNTVAVVCEVRGVSRPTAATVGTMRESSG